MDRRLIRKEKEKKLLEEVNTNQRQIKDLDKKPKDTGCPEAFFLALGTKSAS